MKTVVLDDDPTGTQSATGVTVLLDSSVDTITDVLRDNDSLYIQTNSRAISQDEAVALVNRVRADALAAATQVHDNVRFVLRGDSTLRGHVFAESGVFASEESIMVFVPAFPDGGRTTIDGVHLVRIDDRLLPANKTEYADDPVFPFKHGRLDEYVAEKSNRRGILVSLADVRSGRLPAVLRDAPASSVILPDVSDNNDIDIIAEAITGAQLAGRDIVVRCGAPLAAALAGVSSDGLLPTPLLAEPRSTVVVCGSHTEGATKQMAPVIDAWGNPAIVDTDLALSDSAAAGDKVAAEATTQLDDRGLAIIMSERIRSNQHNTLEHGRRIMEALTAAVQTIAPRLDVVVAKGGITSADIARIGLGARTARVLGQVLPGVSAWEFQSSDEHRVLYIVVPGNVGTADTLMNVLGAVGRQ